uniref:Uncharacterized protein n=1 Tax=Glossina austeni TaxID=7395 RepID=A0A1A9VU96_GLOAU
MKCGAENKTANVAIIKCNAESNGVSFLKESLRVVLAAGQVPSDMYCVIQKVVDDHVVVVVVVVAVVVAVVVVVVVVVAVIVVVVEVVVVIVNMKNSLNMIKKQIKISMHFK